MGWVIYTGFEEERDKTSENPSMRGSGYLIGMCVLGGETPIDIRHL